MFNLNTTRKKTFGLHRNIATILAALLILGALSSSGPTVTQAQNDTENICNFQRNLEVGSRGNDVICLQTYLKSTGHLSGTVTDYFGPNTRQAVIGWQQDQNITPAEGYFGPASRSRYESIQGIQPLEPTPNPTPTPVSTENTASSETTTTTSVDRSALQQQIRSLMMQVIDLLNQLLERRLSEAGIDRSQLPDQINEDTGPSVANEASESASNNQSSSRIISRDSSSGGGGGGGGSDNDDDDNNGGGGGGGNNDSGGDSGDEDTTAPTISSIQAAPTTGGATITWSTNEAADSVVEYGTTASYGSSESNTADATSHSVDLTGLSSSTTYHYRVQSTDTADNTHTSSDRTFTTDEEVDADPNAVLPQDHQYQIIIRDWMDTLTENDFAVSLSPLSWSTSEYSTNDELLSQYIFLQRAYDVRKHDLLRVDKSHFTLDAIEQNGNVYIFLHEEASAEGAAPWLGFDISANVFHENDAAKRRVLVTLGTEMMMQDQDHANGNNKRSDFLGGSLNRWTQAYLEARDVAPANVRAAFRDGFERHLTKLENWGPTDINTNMDTKALSAMYRIGKIFDTDTMWNRVTDLAKRWLFGDSSRTVDNSNGGAGIFHSAGYIGEADGPETTYNGLALNFIAETAIMSRKDDRWPFMDDVLERMYRFKAYQYLPDADGRYEGPSSYAKRTADSYVYDQSSSFDRAAAVAMLTDEAIFEAPIESISKMETEASDGADSQNIYQNYDEASSRTPEQWSEDHWGEGIIYSSKYSIDGSYDYWKSLENQNSPLLDPPASRSGVFSIVFDEEYWAGKDSDGTDNFGWNIETFQDAGWGYDDGFLGGGSLTGFWAADSGIILLGKARGINAYKRDVNGEEYGEKDNFSTVRNWATHHMYGFGTNNEPFSTAKNRHTYPSYNSTSTPTEVTVVGGIGDGADTDNSRYDYDRWAPDGALANLVEYSRTFEKTNNGLKVTSRMNTNGASETVTELWEVLPIYLYEDSQSQDASEINPQIDFRVNGSWQAASDSLVTADAVRITRFGNPAYIVLDESKQMRLRSKTWFTPYQTNNLIKHLEINMLGSTGSSVSLPNPATVSYEIRPNL